MAFYEMNKKIRTPDKRRDPSPSTPPGAPKGKRYRRAAGGRPTLSEGTPQAPDEFPSTSRHVDDGPSTSHAGPSTGNEEDENDEDDFCQPSE